MRVVQLLPELNEGGVERGVVELNRELVKLGVESIVISAGGKQAARIDQDGGRHVRFDLASKSLISAPVRILRLRRLFRELRPDILHARSRVPAWLAWLANRPLRIPFVTTVHGFNSINAYSRVMTYGDRVVCVSQAIKEYVQQHYQVPEEKIAVIPRGVDLDLFNPEQVDRKVVEALREKYRLDGRFVVTAVGRITQLKDYETFIRGVVAAKKQIPLICGLIVGGVRQDKQSYYQSLQDLVKSLGAEDLIRFVGSQSCVEPWYVLSDIVVSCSNKPESFGRTAAEALAMNVPVVASNHGGVLDIVVPGKTGQLFSPRDAEGFAQALLRVREQRLLGLRETISECFSLGKMVEAYFRLYQRFVSPAAVDSNRTAKGGPKRV